MTSAIGASSSSVGSSTATNWLADTITAIKNNQNQGGLLGMLQNAATSDGSINSFLGQSSNTANAFATISQTSLTNASSLVAQIAATNMQQANAKKLQDALNQITAKQKEVQPKNTLDPVIYFADGSTINTTSNILTETDGTQYDITTGLKYVDASSIVQLGNGGTLNTKTNIITMADGTQIDAVTGLIVSKTA
jgi:hypothetical protein